MSARIHYLPLLVLISVPALADAPLDSPAARLDYLIGYQLGASYRTQGIRVTDPEALLEGARDALEDRTPRMSFEEMQRTFLDFQRQRLAAMQAERARELAERRVRGREFLAENARLEGIVVTESGLQYRLLAPGAGRAPTPTDRVRVRFEGRLLDGTVFDSTRSGEPLVLDLGEVIAGWREGVSKLREGGRIELFIPPDLAYGDEGELAAHTLRFEVELLAIVDAEPRGAEAAPR